MLKVFKVKLPLDLIELHCLGSSTDFFGVKVTGSVCMMVFYTYNNLRQYIIFYQPEMDRIELLEEFEIGQRSPNDKATSSLLGALGAIPKELHITF
jgi:hypothetical protein